jgi:hypothetical protein
LQGDWLFRNHDEPIWDPTRVDVAFQGSWGGALGGLQAGIRPELDRLSGPGGKNDAADAAAICEAASRPHMRFVPVKTVERQGWSTVHRLRQAT